MTERQKDRKAKGHKDENTKKQKDEKAERRKDRKVWKTQSHISCSLTMVSLLERQNDKKTEREKEGMTKRQNDKKTERPCREAWLVKMNDIINGDLNKLQQILPPT